MLMAFATDGNDNLPECSGAVVDGTTFELIREAGLDPELAIRNHDSYSALATIGAALPAMDTGTNVNDVFLLVKQ